MPTASDLAAIIVAMAAESSMNGSFGLEVLRLGAPLVREARKLKRLDARVIEFVASTIMSRQPVISLEKHQARLTRWYAACILAIIRRSTRAGIYKSYLHELTLTRTCDSIVSESMFYRIASAIPAGDAKM